MNRTTILLLIFLLVVIMACNQSKYPKSEDTKLELSDKFTLEVIPNHDYGIVIHGGAGNMVKSKFSDSLQAKYHAKLKEALVKGKEMISSNRAAEDVVVEVIKILEDSPLFNAGRGSVFDHKGRNCMDASLMKGLDLSCGSVASLTNIKNPISAARLVMDSTKHVFLHGEECRKFCTDRGMEFMPDEYFRSEKRWRQYLRARNADKKQLDHDVLKKKTGKKKKYGTVGCVVRDKHGNIAAGTSTGGLGNKKHGRIGDSPIIGAGNYANNQSCGVSCTGVGEYFIRNTVASDISARMLYGKSDLKNACHQTLNNVDDMGGRGGVIALDAQGNIVMIFNTKGMFRGYVTSKGDIETKIF